MAMCLGAEMANSKHHELTNNFLQFLINPSFCENVLKVSIEIVKKTFFMVNSQSFIKTDY